MVLEATFMSIVAIALTVFHPGLVFKRQWRDTNYRFRKSRQLKLAAASRGNARETKV